MKHQISIIIPVLNEAETIGDSLKHLSENSILSNISDLIVVDGGSTDGTEKTVRDFIDTKELNVSLSAVENKFNSYRETDTIVLDTKFSKKKFTRTNITLISSPKGRAKQMNLGAKNAKGDIFYFLHADSLPPNRFDKFIIDEVKKGNKAGCFRMQFDSAHWWQNWQVG